MGIYLNPKPYPLQELGIHIFHLRGRPRGANSDRGAAHGDGSGASSLPRFVAIRSLRVGKEGGCKVWVSHAGAEIEIQR